VTKTHVGAPYHSGPSVGAENARRVQQYLVFADDNDEARRTIIREYMKHVAEHTWHRVDNANQQSPIRRYIQALLTRRIKNTPLPISDDELLACLPYRRDDEWADDCFTEWAAVEGWPLLCEYLEDTEPKWFMALADAYDQDREATIREERLRRLTTLR